MYVHRIGRTARMGAKGKAFTFVGKEQGDELTKVENLINMVIPQATVEGFEPNPPPADWTEQKPGYGADGRPSRSYPVRAGLRVGPQQHARAPSAARPRTRDSRSRCPRGRSGARSPSTDGTSAGA